MSRRVKGPDGAIHSFPNDATDAEIAGALEGFARSAPGGPSRETLGRPVGTEDFVPAETAPVGSAVGRFAAGVGEMLNPISIGTGLFDAARHPIDTARNMVRTQYDQGKQAVALAGQGRYMEALGHAGAAALPILGPVAAAAGEQIVAGDIAGGLGKGVGLIAPIAVIPGAVRGAKAVAHAVVPESITSALESGAASRYADVMAPKVGQNKTRFGGMAEKVAPTLAGDTAMGAWSREGLHAKVAAKLDAASSALDAAADARPPTQTATKPLIDGLMAKRAALTSKAVEGSQVADVPIAGLEDSAGRPVTTSAKPLGQDVVPHDNAARVAQIDAAISDLRKLGPVADYEAIRVIRQANDGPARAIYSPAVTADYMKAQGTKLGAADVTGVLRERLAAMDPRTAAANADYSLAKNANDVLDATAEIERVRPKVGRRIAGRVLATMLGEHAAGVPGAVAGYVLAPAVDAAMDMGFTTKLQTAQLMTRLAKAIRAGDEGGVVSATFALKQIGKNLGKKVAAQAAIISSGQKPTPQSSDVTVTMK